MTDKNHEPQRYHHAATWRRAVDRSSILVMHRELTREHTRESAYNWLSNSMGILDWRWCRSGDLPEDFMPVWIDKNTVYGVIFKHREDALAYTLRFTESQVHGHE